MNRITFLIGVAACILICASYLASFYDSIPFEFPTATLGTVAGGVFFVLFFLVSRNWVYLLGAASSLVTSIGFFHKTLHLFGGNKFLIGGIGSFALIFIPVLAYVKYKKAEAANRDTENKVSSEDTDS